MSESEFGVMLCNVEQLGTSLTLQRGQIVRLTPATNQPTKGQFFARPHDGQWADGIVSDDSILIAAHDCESFPNFDALDVGELHRICQSEIYPAPLREYAAISARAQEARLGGRIPQALQWEEAADRLYTMLPEYLRNW